MVLLHPPPATLNINELVQKTGVDGEHVVFSFYHAPPKANMERMFLSVCAFLSKVNYVMTYWMNFNESFRKQLLVVHL